MTREIPLTKGLVALVDDADFDRLSESKWFATGVRGGDYAARWNGALGHNELMHRVILGVEDGVHVDHANRNRLDNRRTNLRPCTVAENRRNTERPNATGYRGISPAKQLWRASITVNGKRIYSCGHRTPEDAARAYDTMAAEHHGEFAVLNFPDEIRRRRRSAVGGLVESEERRFEAVDRSALDRDLFEEPRA